MKQTNSAIKFLLAQYRAIFKNANLKMFLAAATAAVALSSGAAQAVPGDNTEPTPSFGDVLKDSVLSEGEVITQSGNTFTTFDAPADKPVVINGGKLVITKEAESRIFTGRDLVLNTGSIELTGTETQKDILNGLVGADKDTAAGTNYNHSLTVNGGKVNVTSSFIQMKSVTLNGGETTLGGNIGKKMNGGAAPGFFDYSAIHASEGTLTVGGSAVVNLNPASGIYGNYVNINGGTINFNGTSKANGAASDNKSGSYIRAGNPFLNTTLAINDGILNVNEGKFGGIHGTIVEMNGGVLNVNGELTIGTNIRNDSVAEQAPKLGTVMVKGGDVNIGAKGTMIIDGNASFADGTLNNTGIIQFKDIPEGEQRSLTIGAHDFNNSFLKAKTAKLSVNGVAPQSQGTERFDLVVTGNETLDLIGSGFLTEDGALSTKVEFGTNLENSTLTAENASLAAAQYSGKTDIDVGALTAGKAGSFEIKGGSEVTVDHGLTITPKDGKAQVTVGGQLWIDGQGGNVNADVIVNKDASDSSPVNFGAHEGTWNIKGLTLTSGTATFDGPTTVINLGGNLTTTTNGTLNIKDGASVNASAGDLNLVADKVILTAGSTLTLDSADVFTLKNDTVSLVTASDSVKSTFAKDAVTSDETSILNLKYSGEVSIANLEAIKNAIATDTKFKGFLKLDGASIKDRPTADTDLTNVKAGYDGLYNDVAINVGAGGAVDKSFTAGQIKLTGTDTAAAIAAEKTVMLNGSKGDFVVNKDGKAADVSLASGSALVLAGNGSIGAITATGADSGSVVIGHSSLGHGTVNTKAIGGSNAVESLDVLDSNLNVDGAVKTGSLDLIGGSSLKITAKAGSGAITTESLDVSETSSIHAAGQAINVGSATDGSKTAEIYGNVTAESLTIAGSGSHSIAGNATVALDKLDLGTGTGANVSKLAVGVDAPDANGSATVITKSLVGTGTLIIDPVYSQKAALVIADSLKDPSSSTPETNDAGTLAGSAVIGNNSALGIGFKTEAELNGVVGQYLNTHGAFTENPDEGEIANALVLNKKIKIDDNKGILLQKGATTSTTVTNNTVTLGGGTAIIVTDNAFGANKTDAAITLSNSTTNKVVAEGGEVILSGKFDAKDQLQIFSGTGLTFEKGDVVVKTSNGLLAGVISKNGATAGKIEKLDLDEDVVRAQFAGVSAPVQDLLIDTLKGEYKTKKGLGTDFVYTVANTSMNAVELDAVLHAATYAGAQQAAVAAVGTMAEAVAGRVGSTGVETTVLAATGAAGHGGVWVTPMYKSVNSDGFNAQGASYGSDVDLAGVTFGVDSVRGNMRFGAAFNIGSGDADGKGNGNGLKDEFDYYGFGIYTAMNFNHCSLIADASVNVISHDVEGYSGHQEFGTLGASADTTAVTMGVTGQYTHATEFVDVTPHVGMRFTRLDTDSYDLNSAKGVLANTDFDVQNVFSIPVGVTLSKTFEHNGWAYSPAADFTLTFNTGDTEVDSTTHLNDMTNVALNTEVLDEVTYGLNLGFSAQNGSFGTSVNVSYAGSENSDSVGINANARYMF